MITSIALYVNPASHCVCSAQNMNPVKICNVVRMRQPALWLLQM